MDFFFGFGMMKRLGIGIHRHEVNARNARFDHSVNRGAAGAAHANNFDSGKGLNRRLNCFGHFTRLSFH
jgi:hypothetical protein